MRRVRTLALPPLLVAVAMIAAGGSSLRVAPATDTANLLSPRDRAQIDSAFARFFSPSASAARVRGVVEAGSAPLASSLRRAASGLLGEFTQGTARMTVRTATIAPLRRDLVQVTFRVVVNY